MHELSLGTVGATSLLQYVHMHTDGALFLLLHEAGVDALYTHMSFLCFMSRTEHCRRATIVVI